MRSFGDVALSSKDREAIECAVRVLREKFPVEQVILFGSKARGTDDEESDIDLLILTSRPLSWQEQDAVTDELFDIELTCNVLISTLILSTREWTEGVYIVLPIHDEIERDGVVI